MILNFNPRSREGSDYMRSRLVIVTFDFNPRSREGSDVYHHAVDGYRSDFNPRSREGSDHELAANDFDDLLFQSTLP